MPSSSGFWNGYGKSARANITCEVSALADPHVVAVGRAARILVVWVG